MKIKHLNRLSSNTTKNQEISAPLLRGSGLTAIALALLTSTNGLAQEGVSKGIHTLEEIIITARKREESIMKVPVVASTLSAEELRQYAIGDMRSIADKVPGLNIGSNVLTSGVQVTLRGVGTSTLNPAVDQSTALNVDGMQMSQGYAYKMALFDMAQAEVLKGPQALFYGKASPAGVISVRTADPTDEFDVTVRAGYETEAEEMMTELIVSGPLSETLGARFAAKYSDAEGYFTNVATPGTHPFFGPFGGTSPADRNFDETEYLLLRGTLVWEPSDVFNARVKLNYAEEETPNSGGNGQMASCPDGVAGVIPGLDFIGSEDCKVDDKVQIVSLDPAFFPNVYNGGEPFRDAEQMFGTLEWNYEIRDDLTLTSVTGYYEIEVEALINATGAATYGPMFAANNILERDDFTQEFRLTSDFDSDINFMVGAFYHEGTTNFYTGLPLNQIGAQLFPPPTSLLTTFGEADHTIDTEALSLFGQVLWNLSPDWELGAGVRWTDEERDHAVINSGLVDFGIPPFPVNLAQPKLSSDNWSPELSLTYTPSDDLTVFTTLKRAYKSGSFDVGGIPADGGKTNFDDEQVTGGDLGIKSRWMDGRLVINAAGYYYEFEDLQVERSEFDALAGRFLTRTINAASAEVYGIDFDVTYAPESVADLTLFAAANWNIAEYDKFDTATCWGGQTIANGCNLDFDANVGLFTSQDLSGEPLVRAPKWSANFGFDYQTTVFENMTLALGSNINYSSKYLMNALARDDMYQDSYFKISARAALRAPDDAWEVALIGDNLNDELVAGNCGLSDYANAGVFGQIVNGAPTSGPGGVHELSCNVERGRALWLQVTLKPGLLFQ